MFGLTSTKKYNQALQELADLRAFIEEELTGLADRTTFQGIPVEDGIEIIVSVPSSILSMKECENKRNLVSLVMKRFADELRKNMKGRKK